MPTADSLTLVSDAGNAGDKCDLVSVTVSAVTVIRQVVTLGDPTTGTSYCSFNLTSGALDESVAYSLRTAAHMYGYDSAAGAGSRQVPLRVESTAQPNLRVSHWNAGNAMPAGDAVARRIYIQHTDGTNSTPSMDAVARRAYFQHTDGTNSTPAADANSRPLYVTEVPNAATGGSKAKNEDVTTVVAIKASAGTLYGLQIYNGSGATAFIQLFDVAAGSVTLGTTTPDQEFRVANGEQMNVPLPLTGVTYGTAITVASTTTQGGATPSGAGVNVFSQYK